jgi:hypothetical protein
MKRFVIAVIAAAGATLGATQAPAAVYVDSFRFQLGAAMAPPLYDDYKHRSDFLHYDDYYVTPGYGDPYRHTSCVETRVRDEEGRAIRRINCYERGGQGVPLR